VPIYEFYCADCHTIYNFLSRRVNTTKRPSCPKCGRPKLERKVSRVAIGRGGKKDDSEGGEGGEGEGDDFDLPPGVDEKKLERAMMELASEAEHMDENDPRQMAQLMRKLSQATGLQFGGAMEEAIRRLEAGEDPDAIEEDLGDLLDEEEPFFQEPSGEKKKKLRGIVRRLRPPNVDENLYDLE